MLTCQYNILGGGYLFLTKFRYLLHKILKNAWIWIFIHADLLGSWLASGFNHCQNIDLNIQCPSEKIYETKQNSTSTPNTPATIMTTHTHHKLSSVCFVGFLVNHNWMNTYDLIDWWSDLASCLIAKNVPRAVVSIRERTLSACSTISDKMVLRFWSVMDERKYIKILPITRVQLVLYNNLKSSFWYLVCYLTSHSMYPRYCVPFDIVFNIQMPQDLSNTEVVEVWYNTQLTEAFMLQWYIWGFCNLQIMKVWPDLSIETTTSLGMTVTCL